MKKTIPDNRILLETDSPFAIEVKSVPMLKKQLLDLVSGISELRRTDMGKIIEDNSLRIFVL